MLTGKRPFDSDIEYTILTADVLHVPDPPDKLNPICRLRCPP